MSVSLLVGTAKGAFVFRSNSSRSKWAVDGPLFPGWKVTAAARNPSGDYLVGIASDVYGTAIQKSSDLREWRQVPGSPQYDTDAKRKLTQIWTILANEHGHYCGVADAGLFRSDDQGENWQPVDGLNDHPTRRSWCPGAGGLCAHAILIDSKNPERLWCGISAVGVFRSDDGGRSWNAKNEGIPVILEDQEFPEIGFCVHALAQDSENADLIYRQDHAGMFRSQNGGDSWQRTENGLPSGFGFPIVQDRRTRHVYAIPLKSDEYRFPTEGKLRVYRSRNGGETWEAQTDGLPQENCYTGVLRGAMDADHLEPGGVYFGTTSGELYASTDGGDRWQRLPGSLPRIHCVKAFVQE